MQNRCVAGCAIWVCVSALCGILTMTTLPNDAFFRMCPHRSVRKSFHNGVKCTAWKAEGGGFILIQILYTQKTDLITRM